MANLAEDRVRRIEDLVQRIGAIPDRESRESAHQLMESILELHGAGLERMMEIVFEAGECGEAAIRRFTNDELVSSLLVLHNLHPDDIETRVSEALRKWHGKAELIGVFEGAVRVRLSGDGCGLRDAIEAAIRTAAPDATEVVIDEAAPSMGFVPLAALGMGIPRVG